MFVSKEVKYEKLFDVFMAIRYVIVPNLADMQTGSGTHWEEAFAQNQQDICIYSNKSPENHVLVAVR